MHDENPGSAATIYDIAREVGLSATTVGRALSGKGRVSAETRQRVRDAAARIGYRPSMIAQSLSHRRTNMLGVVVPSIGDTVFSVMVRGIEHVANENGYSIILCDTDMDYGCESHYYDVLHRRRVEGIITCPFGQRPKENPFCDLLALEDAGIPVVVLEENIPEDTLTKVVPDNYCDARRMTEHLIGIGHERIGFVHAGLPEWNYSGRERLDGYRTALANAGLPLDSSLVARMTKADLDPNEDGLPSSLFLAYLDRANPTAVFASHDMLAIKLILVCNEAGIRVPQDLAIVGFDDILAAACVPPPLTTIHQPAEELGRRAAEIMFQRIEGKLTCRVSERLLGRLVVRRSCGAWMPAGETDHRLKMDSSRS